jgi:D-erythro-7,8-dihydroneopterin triphosphate epimerase
MSDFSRDQIAKIHIQDLRLRTYIGINEDEKKNRQDVVINIRIHYHAAKAVSFNEIDEALNYRTITKRVIRHVEENRFLLLERMTDEVLALVMEHPEVMWADVQIDKPHALRFSDSVSIALSARREGYAGAEHPRSL